LVVTAGLALDRAGNLFIADTGNHSVRRVSPAGIINTVAGNGTPGFSGDGGSAVSARLNSPVGVALDGAGNLFIADRGNYRIRKVSTGGIISTVAGNGGCCFSGDGGSAVSAALAPVSVTVDGAGDLIVADSVHIRKVSSDGTITTVAGSGALGFAGDGGPATSAQLNAWAVAAGSTGELFIASICSIRKVSAGGTISTVAGTCMGGFSGDDGPATSARLGGVFGVAVDGAGNLFIVDAGNARIRKVSSSGVIITLAGNGSFGSSFSGDGGPASSARLSYPYGVAVDVAGNVFVADTSNNRIRRVSPGGIITTVAGNGTLGFSGDGGPATKAQLNAPFAVALDRAGNIFFVDGQNHARIRKVSTTGLITTVAGNGSQGFSGDGGPATNASLESFVECNALCGGVAVDSAGNLFIADAGNSRVRKVTSDGIITTVAGNGAFGAASGDGGPATNAQLSALGVALDLDGNLFIAGSDRVRKVSKNGVITTVAGGGVPGSSGDGGPATSAHLSDASAIAIDGAGNLFIADPGGNFFAGGDAGEEPCCENRIRKVSTDGIITTVAGSGAFGFAGDGGAAITAALNGPSGVAVDGAGNVYVTDSRNDVVRVLRPATQPVLLSAVVDAASQNPDPISPGKIVVAYGVGLGPSSLVQNKPSNQSGGGQFGTQLSGTTVSLNGVAAPILYTSATQVAAVVPYGVTGTSAQVTVTYQGQTSAFFTVPVAASAPSLFTSNQTGAGQAAAINAVDGTVNTAANPVKIGDYLSLYATGEGQTAPAGVDGKLGGSILTHPLLPVSVTIGGIPATVQYSGGVQDQVAGLLQVNVQIPSGVQPGGYVPVILQVGDRTSSPAVWIAVSGN
jgi:uncharacterized protein (TIGR03437 family)